MTRYQAHHGEKQYSKKGVKAALLFSFEHLRFSVATIVCYWLETCSDLALVAHIFQLRKPFCYLRILVCIADLLCGMALSLLR